MCEMAAMEQKTQIAGCTVIVDAKRFKFKQLKKISIEDISLTVSLIQVNSE